MTWFFRELLDLISNTSWPEDFDTIWNMINKFIHSNGIEYMNQKYHPDSFINNHIPEYNKTSLNLFLDHFIKVMQQVAIIAATMKPELLNEDMAYQIEIQTHEPLIGCGLWGGAVSIFFDLIPDHYNEFFKKFHVECGENSNRS